MTAAPKQIVVDVDQVDEDPDNARLTFDAAELQILAESLKDRQLYAIQVRKLNNGRYQLVDGARRLRAAKLAGIKQLRADDLGGHIDAKTAAILAATANLEREDLSPLEEARAFDRLLKAGLNKKQITERFGIPFNTLQGRLELLELPEAVAKRIGDARGGDGTVFGLGHAKALLPLVKHQDLLDVGLMVFGENLPDASRAPQAVAEGLLRKGVIVDAASDVPYQWRHEVKDFEKRIAALPHVKLVRYGSPQNYVTDIKAWKALKTEFNAEYNKKQAKQQAAAKQEKAAAKVDPAKAKALEEKHRKERELATTARPIQIQLEAHALGVALGGRNRLAELAWRDIADTCDNLRFDDEDITAAVVAQLGKALKLDVDAVAKTFHDVFDNEARSPKVGPMPTWFSKAPVERQFAFHAGLRLLNELVSYGAEQKVKELTGVAYGQFKAQATNQARDEIQRRTAAANLKSKLAHGDKKKPTKGGGAPPASSKKGAPAPKANGKAKAKVAVKVTPAVAKARATLSKTKQAVPAASPAPAKPLEAPAPAASPREIADKVLADVLPGLPALKQAAADNGIQA